jgi:uncharacterized protein (DUF362 family)
LLYLQKEAFQSVTVQNESLKICKKALEADYLINISRFERPIAKLCSPVLLKNLKGCIPNSENGGIILWDYTPAHSLLK